MDIKQNGSHKDERRVGQLALIISFSALIAAIVQLIMTISINVSISSDPTQVYHRNISSVVAFILLSYFFNKYYDHMKASKVISALLFFACLAKIAISTYYTMTLLSESNLVGLYYLCDAAVWSMVAVFAIFYYRKFKKRESNK